MRRNEVVDTDDSRDDYSDKLPETLLTIGFVLILILAVACIILVAKSKNKYTEYSLNDSYTIDLNTALAYKYVSPDDDTRAIDCMKNNDILMRISNVSETEDYCSLKDYADIIHNQYSANEDLSSVTKKDSYYTFSFSFEGTTNEVRIYTLNNYIIISAANDNVINYCMSNISFKPEDNYVE